MAAFTSLCPAEPRTLFNCKATEMYRCMYVTQNDRQKLRSETSEAEHRLQNPSFMDKILKKEQDSEECVIPGHSTLSIA